MGDNVSGVVLVAVTGVDDSVHFNILHNIMTKKVAMTYICIDLVTIIDKNARYI